MAKIIGKGAEAIITLDNNKVIKNRIKKSYRIRNLDERLRKSRTKSESKIINKLNNIIPVPKIISTDEKQEIIMDYIEGKKLSDNLEKLNYKQICKIIAENITKLHNQNIIHGDLTTSNMIYVESNKLTKSSSQNSTDLYINDISSNIVEKASKRSLRNRETDSNASEAGTDNKNKVYFIDFGLAFNSYKIEDKAVDLHLLQQALEAKHFTIWQECWNIILDNYNPKDAELIKKRIKIIESRGRYKEKY